MRKTKTEFQKIRSMHAKLTPENSPAMKGGPLYKLRKEKTVDGTK